MRKYFLFILAVAAVGFSVWYFSNIFLYIIIAGILSRIGQPIGKVFYMISIGKFKLPQTVCAVFALITLFLIFFLLVAFFMPLVAEEGRILSSIDTASAMAALQAPMEQMDALLRTFRIEYDSSDMRTYFQDKISSVLTITNLSLFFNQIISALGDFFIAFFSISFLTFFFLRDEKVIANAIISMAPENYSEKVKNVLIQSERMLKRYFIGILIEVLLVATFLFIGLSLAGINHALLIAVFAGIINVIPYVGPLIGAGFALFIGLSTNTDMTMIGVIIKICIVFPVVNLFDAFLLQPLIYSSSVKAHPLEIFLVILIGGTIGGVGGMIFAVPSYTVLRVIAKEFFTHFRFVKQLTKKFGE